MIELEIPTFRFLGPSEAIPNNFVVPYYLDHGKRRVSIARVGNNLYAFDDLCTCGSYACPLSAGLLEGKVIMCQCHGSRFDISTGAVIDGPAKKALDVYDVEEVEGRVRVRV